MSDTDREQRGSDSVEAALAAWKQLAVVPWDIVASLTSGRHDAMTLALRGHMIITRILNDCMCRALPDADPDKVKRIDFGVKAEMVCALGLDLLSPEWRGLLACFNTIRNKLAHDLDYEYSDGNERDLKNAFPMNLRMVWREAETQYASDHPALRFAIDALYQAASFGAHKRDVDRMISKASRMHLRKVLDGEYEETDRQRSGADRSLEIFEVLWSEYLQKRTADKPR